MVLSENFHIPPLPESLICCISYLYKDNFNYDVFVKKLTLDVGIMGKIFEVANSQYYSQGSAPVDNLKQALVRIGVSSLLQILTSEYYKTSFKNVDVGFFTLQDFNRHSSYVSQLAVALGVALDVKDTHDLMVAGLFHDVGLIVRSFCQHDVMQKIVNKCAQVKNDFYSVEISENIPDHNVLGKDVVLQWHLSKRVSYLIEGHQIPEVERKKTIDFELHRDLDILNLADILAHRASFGYRNYTRNTSVNKILLDRLGLSVETIAKITQETQKAVSALVF